MGYKWNKGMILEIRKRSDHELVQLYEEYIHSAEQNRCAYNHIFINSRMPFVKHEMKKRKLG